MGKSSRVKGHTYEREVRDAFRATGYPSQRNITQARDRGVDLLPIGPLRVEAKRRARLPFMAWLQQAQAASGAGDIPLVVCRQDGAKSSQVILSLDDFLRVFAAYYPPTVE